MKKNPGFRGAIGVLCQAFLQESLKEFSEKRIITNSKEGRSVENKDFSAFVAELKQKSDIVDVIGSYVPVRQKGRSYWAACPFHHEKTPSFSISRNGQFYNCLLYTSPSPRDNDVSRMPSSA